MRVHSVSRARKSKARRVCGRCGHEVQPGESYKYAEPRYGPKKFWCKDHYPKRSELTSAKIGAAYDLQDDFDVSSCEDIVDIEGAVQDVISGAEEVRDEYQEGLDAMPEGTESSPIAEQAQEMIDALEEWTDALETLDYSELTLDEAKEVAENAVNELSV